MLRAFDWTSFLIILLGATVLYYLILFIVYFRKDPKNMLPGRKTAESDKKKKIDNRGLIPNNPANKENPDTDEEQQFSIAHSLGNQLKHLINEAAIKKTVREELMMSIQMILSKDIYKPMKGTAFGIAINNLIQYECETQCSVHLSALEVNGLWTR